MKKNSLLRATPEKADLEESFNNTSFSSSVEISTDFIEAIRQERERKRYNNTTRKTWDEFGQAASERIQLLTQKKEYHQRQILLKKVKDFWIEGFLKPSLYDKTAINLDFKNRPDLVLRPFESIEEIPVELDKSFEELQQTDILKQIGQGKTLLILGEPGTGKTIALLQIAQNIIQRAEPDSSQPIPVVFNLSSWTKQRQTIEKWLTEELKEQYGVPKLLSQLWIEREQMILLLDGLDEVKAEYRNTCVRALNNFVATHSMTEMVVCSRIKDYQALTERLQLSSAICIQPLSSEQVDVFLEKAGDSLVGLKTLLQQNRELKKFVQTPLILNIMSQAYQGWSVKDLSRQLRSTETGHQNLWNAYIKVMLTRKRASAKYSKDKVLKWLSWLAKRMMQESRTVFSIEKMQPDWLGSKWKRLINVLIVSLVAGLIALPLFGLINGLIYGWINRPTYEPIDGAIYGLIYGLIGGVIYGLIYGLIGGVIFWLDLGDKKKIIGMSGGMFIGLIVWIIYEPIYGLIVGLMVGLSVGMQVDEFTFQIKAVETLSLSAIKFSKNLIYGIILVVIPALIFLLYVKLNQKPIIGLTEGLIYALINGLVVGLTEGLEKGLVRREIERKTSPNQGIFNSLKNMVIVFSTISILMTLSCIITTQVIKQYVDSIEVQNVWNDGLIIVVLLISILMSVYTTGMPAIQHFILRLGLWLSNYIPWNYARFLDYASELLLIKKVGGGYVFYHRMLMEHFAQMKLN